MKNIVAILCILATSCLHATTYARRDLSWMRKSTVTIMRLAGYHPAEGHPAGPFHGLEVLERHELNAESRDALVEFLIRVANREDSEFIQAERRGRVTGGVWGCISGGHGIRFELDGQRHDFVVECGLWVQPADPAQRERPGREGTRWVFTKDEGREWQIVFERHFVKGP